MRDTRPYSRSVETIQTMAELRDTQKHFQMYYSVDLQGLKNTANKKGKRRGPTAGGDADNPLEPGVGGEDDDDLEDVTTRVDPSDKSKYKQSNRGNSQYGLCVKYGLS